MPSFSRRSVLRASATVSAVGLAGCSALRSPDPPELGYLRARNYHDEPHTVHVELEADGRSVYSGSKQLPAAPDGDRTAVTFRDHPTDPARYVFRVWYDDQRRTEGRRVDITDYEAECLTLFTEIWGPVADDSGLAVLVTGDTDYCEQTSTDEENRGSTATE